MEPTLDGALADLFGAQQPQRAHGIVANTPTLQAQQPPPQMGEARDQLNAAQKAMQQGNWEDFGRAMHNSTAY